MGLGAGEATGVLEKPTQVTCLGGRSVVQGILLSSVCVPSVRIGSISRVRTKNSEGVA
jgi:hypothetical protein